MTEREIAMKIVDMASSIAKSLYRGKEVQINKVNGTVIKFSEVGKKEIK